MLHLSIVNPNREFCSVAERQFSAHQGVEIIHGRFEDAGHFDCIVTAGNSFGLMAAGIDLAVVKYFGTEIQDRIQQEIISDYLGEQPVGTSIIVPTGNPRHPFVAHSPTMRIPANISGTDNVYLAMWGTLLAIHRHNKTEEKRIEYLLCPGLGAGTGGLDPEEATLQMLMAYEHFIAPPEFLNGSFAQRRHERVHYGAKWGFEHPRDNS